METPANLYEIKAVEPTAGRTDEVAWLARELRDASPGCESNLIRLLLARIALNNMFQLCMILDEFGTVWDVNDTALRKMGLARGDIHGTPFWAVPVWESSPEATQLCKEAVARAARGEFVRHHIDIPGRNDGTERIAIDFNIQPVRDHHGIVRFLLCAGRDVTAQRDLERQVVRQREEFATRDERPARSLADASHEIRMVLALMLGPIEDALADQAEPLSTRQRERAEMAQRQGRRLQSLVGHAHPPQDHLDDAGNTTAQAESFERDARLGQANAKDVANADESSVVPRKIGAERLRLLLVGDNADTRDCFQLLLAAEHDVAAVSDGEAALGAAKRSHPDLILMDSMIACSDAFEPLRRLRADPMLSETPVIVLSSRADEGVRAECLRAGADDYLAKPFDAHALLARVAASIKLARSRSPSPRFLRDEARMLKLLNRVGMAVAAEPDLEQAVQLVTDAATDISGAAFGSFFYNVLDESGEAYMLYTLSGVPREAFAKFPMPRNTAIFGPTFRGERIVRSDDITKNAGYGKNEPYFGMPQGHLPVRSYMAVPVTSRSGEVLGGLFFGHPDAGIFSERAERIVAAIAVQAGIAIDKARLYRAARDEIARRRLAEAALRESEEALEARVLERTAELAASNARLLVEAEAREKAEGRFTLLVEGVVDYAIFMLDSTGVITNWNTGAQRIKGYLGKEIVGQHFSRFYTEEDRLAGLPKTALNTAAKEGKYEAEGWRVRKDGSRFWASVVIDAIRDNEGTLLGFAKITRDVSERREATLALQRAQEQLAQAQKMEGIGHLTGGVAHDFNNLLTIVMGNLEILQRTLQDPKIDTDRLLRSVDNAMLGAKRAATLTQRLLAFARQQPLEPKIVEVGKLVSGMSDLLRRTLGEQVAIETVLAGGLWRVHADPNQLEIAILNLAVNARDAMPEGGNLTIETANANLDDAYAAQQPDVLAGDYVVVSVTDNGCGMTREVVARVFEPFFTTKDIGHGTGLGLSQVYGFVKQSGGHVKIYSEPGKGTTVRIYLPRLDGTDIGVAPPQPSRTAPHGNSGETILVVEDEADVRAYSKEILHELGYRTYEAATAHDALQALQRHPEIQLLFTDIGLPGGMNGRQLADEAQRRHGKLDVLFTTGYARDAIVHDGRLDPGIQLITKPFTYAALAAKLRGVLDAKRAPRRALVVEDEELIRLTVAEQLEELGFETDVAGSATEAMDKLELCNGALAVAIVDIGLPDRRGDVLVSEMRARFPVLPIVVSSGYGDALRNRFKNDARIAFLGKPYNDAQLRAVFAALDVMPGDEDHSSR